MAEEQRFILGLAYQCGRDPRIAKAQDGGAATSSPPTSSSAPATLSSPAAVQVGAVSHGPPVRDGSHGRDRELIYRNEVPWVIKAADGSEQVIKCGDWVIGGICDDIGW